MRCDFIACVEDKDAVCLRVLKHDLVTKSEQSVLRESLGDLKFENKNVNVLSGGTLQTFTEWCLC